MVSKSAPPSTSEALRPSVSTDLYRFDTVALKAKMMAFLIGATIAAAPQVKAHDGFVAIATELTDIEIDGSNSEWSGIPKVELTNGSPASDQTVTRAWMQTATDPAGKYLYVMIEVEDDEPVFNPNANDPCEEQDCHLIYVDRQHSKNGSGIAGYLAGGSLKEINVPPGYLDPANSTVSLEDAEYASTQNAGKTYHEWRIYLGETENQIRSIGFDVFLIDYDKSDQSETVRLWSPGYGKSANPYRLGDLVLSGGQAAVGTVRGRIGWDTASTEPMPETVTLQSIEFPGLHVEASVNAVGEYDIVLPVGDYHARLSPRLTKRFRTDFSNFPKRIDDKGGVLASAVDGQDTVAALLSMQTIGPPEELIGSKGVLSTTELADPAMIDAFVRAHMEYYRIPGVSFAVIKNGEIVHAATLGVKNSLTQEPAISTTLFEGASMTKAMFAIAAMKFAARGELDLDRPLLDYLSFPNIEGDDRARKLTARHVLSHRSGLPNWFLGSAGTWQNAGDVTLAFEPGTQFQYSGEAFDYLGRVMESISGRTLNEIMVTEVSTPMNLCLTRYMLSEAEARNASIGHFQTFPVWRSRPAFVSPASSVVSTGPDFENFLLALVDPNSVDRALLDSMFEPQVEIPEQERVIRDGWQQWMGTGFFVKETPLGRAIEHGGNNDDFDAKFSVIPSTGSGYVMFTNSNVGDELIQAFERFLIYGSEEAAVD